MKNLVINIIIALLLASCESDREYIKDRYLSYQAEQDLEQNRQELYQQSYVGVRNEIPQN